MYTVIECSALINCYFSMMWFVWICAEYLNADAYRNTILTLQNELNIVTCTTAMLICKPSTPARFHGLRPMNTVLCTVYSGLNMARVHGRHAKKSTMNTGREDG